MVEDQVLDNLGPCFANLVMMQCVVLVYFWEDSFAKEGPPYVPKG